MADLAPVSVPEPGPGGKRGRRATGLLAQLLATSMAAYCGAKGSPQPPLPAAPAAAAADAGQADAGPPDGGAP